MRLPYIDPVWRPAALRGVSLDAGRCEALLSFGAQYLRLPLSEAHAQHWRSRIGRRVWVDMGAGALRAGGPGDDDAD